MKCAIGHKQVPHCETNLAGTVQSRLSQVACFRAQGEDIPCHKSEIVNNL